MKVYFIDSHGNKRVINDSAATSKEVHKTISDFLNKHNFKSSYVRSWYADGMTWFDVGSHCEFFTCDENLMEENK